MKTPRWVQMEFEALLAEVAGLSGGGDSGGGAGGGGTEVPEQGGLDFRWLDRAGDLISEEEELRRALVFAASCLAEVVDLHVIQDGVEEEWAARYPDYCEWVAESLEESVREGNDDPDLALETCAALWREVRRIFDLYEERERLSDWELECELCEGHSVLCAACDWPECPEEDLRSRLHLVHLLQFVGGILPDEEPSRGMG